MLPERLFGLSVCPCVPVTGSLGVCALAVTLCFRGVGFSGCTPHSVSGGGLALMSAMGIPEGGLLLTIRFVFWCHVLCY